MPFSLQVRPAVATDAHALAALAIQVWLDTYATDGVNDLLGRHVLDAFTPSGFSALAQDPAAALLVAQNDAHLVGYALLRFDSAQPLALACNTELCTLYVQERFTRAGVGTALLEQARIMVRERSGAGAMWLAVNTRNQRACRFYEKHGFSLKGRTWFALGEDRHENHVFAVP